jgi:hypothetical protein
LLIVGESGSWKWKLEKQKETEIVEVSAHAIHKTYDELTKQRRANSKFQKKCKATFS